MNTQSTLRRALQAGALDERLHKLCGGQQAAVDAKKARLTALLTRYAATFGEHEEVGLFSGPGRTELGGNHTDHERGCILAGSVDMDLLACAAKSEDMCVELYSEGYPTLRLDLSDLSPRSEEKQTSAALVRGIAARMHELGCPVGGFHAVMDSTVPGGSGLSSSAAYEVLIGVILSHLYGGDRFSMTEIAQIGQWAENHYFDKPCGLMDQLASAVGGVVSVDFFNPEKPVVRKLEVDFAKAGYTLCIVDSGADHADLTEEYTAIPHEMQQVAAYFGKQVLREVPYEQFWSDLAGVRAKTGDRAVLRAIHYYSDHYHAQQQAQALRQGDFARFLTLVRQSGISSATMLQNLYCTARPHEQAVCVALASALHLLGGQGAARVHGGGFAGTIQAYVPLDKAEAFTSGMERVLGAGCCHFALVRPEGGAVIA